METDVIYTNRDGQKQHHRGCVGCSNILVKVFKEILGNFFSTNVKACPYVSCEILLTLIKVSPWK